MRREDDRQANIAFRPTAIDDVHAPFQGRLRGCSLNDDNLRRPAGRERMDLMRRLVLASLTAAFAVVVLAPAPLVAQAEAPAPRVERDAVYGMYSGLALLMDVHRPPTPNGVGIVAITGVGWHAGAAYGPLP